jgi:uncharacterized Zn finger protein
MTVFKRGAVYLNCLICGYGDFDIVRHTRIRSKALRCKKCGFMFREGGYFDSMPKGTPVPVDGHSLFTVRKGV